MDDDSVWIDEETEVLSPKKIVQRLKKRAKTGQKYLLARMLAEGGMGKIYLVFDKALRRKTVLKVIHPEIRNDAELFQKFVEEAQITGQLEHPNIVPVHDIGLLKKDEVYFSMKYVEAR